MKIDAIVRLFLYIGIPFFMTEEEQNQAKVDFTSKRFIATYGLLALSLVFVLMEPIF